MKVLNVAEKNAAASTIAYILANGQCHKRDGFSKFNKVFEFPCAVFDQQCQMIMTSVSGHLMNLDYPPQFRNWEKVALMSLFEAPINKNVSQNMLGIQKTLEQQAKHCQKLIIWTDCDREGENIGYEIIDLCKKINPRIDVWRARFSEMTGPAIKRAINNLVRPDIRLSQAVDVRSELDLRTGAAFTRFQTLRLRKQYRQHLDNMTISYGSCQFPTLGFVVDRYKQIQEFVIEDFWKIKMNHSVNNQIAEFNWARVRLFDEACCRVILQLLQEKPLATVTSVQSKPKQKWRPQALDTVEMEKLAVRKLRITAKKAMTMAESLYTRGIISYPRTETNIFPNNMNLNGLVQGHTNHPDWGEFAGKIMNEFGGARPRNGKKTDNAHPPIHPTKCVSRIDFQDQDEWRLYDLITRHFLACCSADAEGKEYCVEVDVNGEQFSAAGLTILALNYLEVYPFDRWSEKTIPEYQQGQTFQPTVLDIVAGQTAPPPLLTEADLISLMEKHGIGTDATHAEHIDKIQQRFYVGVTNDKRFTPGQLGMGLVEGYDSMGFQMSKPNLRAEFEADLQRVCDGLADHRQVLQHYIGKYRDIFSQAVQHVAMLDEKVGHYLGAPLPGANENDIDWGNGGGGGGGGDGGDGGDGFGGPGAGGGGASLGFLLDQQQDKLASCPSCQMDILLKSRKNGGFYFGCMGYPDCRISIWLPESIQSVKILDQSCQKCSSHPQLVEIYFKAGQTPGGLESPHRCCFGGCDSGLYELLDVRPLNRPGGGATQMALNGQQRAQFGTSNIQNNSTAYRGPISNSTAIAVAGPTAMMPSRQQSINMIPPRESNNFQRTSGGGGPQPFNKAMSPGSNHVLCSCNNPAARLTVRKEGPNQGRPFFKCAESACNFFLWDEGQDQADGGGPSRPQQRGGGAGEKKCTSCGQPALRLTAKNGQNAGRNFWSCRRPGEGGCGKWLEWADDDGGGGAPPNRQGAPSWNNGSGASSHGRGGGSSYNRGTGGRGRGNSPGNKLGFLGGGHAAGGHGPTGAARGRGAKRSFGGDKGGDTPSAPKQRKCGQCGEPGHTKKNCPNA